MNKANQKNLMEQLLDQELSPTDEQYLAYRRKVSDSIRKVQREERIMRIVTKSAWAVTAGELGQALRIGLPNAQHAEEFFRPSRSPEVRAIAAAAIEHSGDHRERHVRLLTEEVPEPFQVRLLIQQCFEPAFRCLVERPVFGHETNEAGVFDELPGGRQKSAGALNRPAPVKGFGPGHQWRSELQIARISQVHGHAHAGVVGDPLRIPQLGGQPDHRVLTKSPELRLRLLGV